MSFEDLYVNLLPARTTLTAGIGAFGGNGGTGGAGGNGGFAQAMNSGNINFGGAQNNIAIADASGGDGGSANGGAAAAAGRDQMLG